LGSVEVDYTGLGGKLLRPAQLAVRADMSLG
jgi:hypothetical protein